MTCNTMSDDNVIDDFRDISYNFVLESISLWCLGTRLGCLDTQHNDSHSSVSIDKQMMTIATKELFESYQRLYYSSKLWKYVKTKPYRHSKLWKYVKTKPYRQLERSESCIYDTLSKYVDLAFSSKTGYESLMNELINLDTLSVNEIKVYLMDFIIGGLFTVSNALNFVCYHLANNPSIQQNLLREINAVTTDQNEITSQMLSQMPYLKACIKESFRLTSTVPGIVRVLPSDVILSGYHIPKGDNRHDWPSFSVLPFGFGSRMCVGKRFAQLHIQMAVLYIIKHFEISVDESDEIELICNFLIIANRRIKLKVKRR
ncbi:unnamed protein product [Medioppia subpectinata]|uniref:Cytochrome P450 n=1 Tax=Medioppia subpectinata TaxID=1979941 RepID=A0A7R9KI58_9ACAR|nr:unnamed protein product [Medioppia subpectinata]CAG2103950.1 unnamed protein product [Medioppia subpectinata]